MLISVADLHQVFHVRPTQVLHVGAHLAEEEPAYKNHGWGHITWVEAQPSLVRELKLNLPQTTNTILEGAVWETSGVKLVLKIASNSQSSSLLDFGTHSTMYPSIEYVESIEVTTICLSDLLPEQYEPDFINLDLQGVELAALRGLGSRIKSAKWIYCEVNLEEVYKNCTLLKDLDEYLKSAGFVRLSIKLAPNKTWGDAIYGTREMYSDYKIQKMRIRHMLKSFIFSDYPKSIRRNMRQSLIRMFNKV